MTTCIHCQAMAAEIAELRAALGLSGRLTVQREIGRRFGLTPTEARIAQALYDAAGRVVPRASLDDYALTQEAAESGSNALHVHVSRIRAKIGRQALDTADGGYSMSAVGRALIYTALKVNGVAA